LLRLDLLPVALNEVKLLSVTIAGVKIILLHLSICLVIVPVIVIEAVYRAHYSGAMPSACTVHVKLTGGGIVNNFQKLIYLGVAWRRFINDGYVDIAHSSSNHCGFLALPGIVSQIDDGLDSQCGQVLKLFRFWPPAAIKPLIHLAKVVDLDDGETALICLGKSDG